MSLSFNWCRYDFDNWKLKRESFTLDAFSGYWTLIPFKQKNGKFIWCSKDCSQLIPSDHHCSIKGAWLNMKGLHYWSIQLFSATLYASKSLGLHGFVSSAVKLKPICFFQYWVLCCLDRFKEVAVILFSIFQCMSTSFFLHLSLLSVIAMQLLGFCQSQCLKVELKWTMSRTALSAH